MRKKSFILALAMAVATSGCSTASKDIATSYVSPMQYAGYDCEQLTAEALRLQQRVQQLGARLDQAAANDRVITGVGVLLFWPALFALGGTKEQEAEYARLKGEYDAVQQVAMQKKCAGLPPPAPQLAKPDAAPVAAGARATEGRSE